LLSGIKAFNVLAKPIGPICNLNCKCCFYLEKEKLYPAQSKWEMKEDVLESFIKQYIEVQNAPEINFAWQDGEPTLLGVNYFEKVIEYQKKYSNVKSISNSFQTNGVLLNEEWCNLLALNKFLIGISIYRWRKRS
jgi:uncharacterized protein